MKKLILLCIVSVMCCSLWACSSSETTSNASTGIPDDLVVVLPDGQELYLYMPHDDAAEILGPADSMEEVRSGKIYNYDELFLSVAYKNNLLVYSIIRPGTPCHLRNGLNPSSKKTDFINADFPSEDAPIKYYLINGTHYELTKALPTTESFQSAAVISGSYKYVAANKPDFEGYSLSISDYRSGLRLEFDD